MHVVHEAFARLSMLDCWHVLEPLLKDGAELIYFALDLNRSEASRVKVYMRFENATADLITQKFAMCKPPFAYEDVEAFTSSLSGIRNPQLLSKKAVILCYAFSNADATAPVGMLHFPLSHYGPNDEALKTRVESLLALWTGRVATDALTRYQACIKALAHRPLDSGRGLHGYASLKCTKAGLALTFYLSSEMYYVLPVEL